MLQGAEDHITPAELAEQYFGEVTAPSKRLVLLDDAGHFAMMTHTEQFTVALRETIESVRR